MIYIFTGAGCSADSGIPTFRDAGGLWEQFDPDEICYLPKFISDPAIRPVAFEFYNKLKTEYADAQPHAGQIAITELQKRTPVKVITTNIDMLHEAAGTSDVLHLHGSVLEENCAHCGHSWHIGEELWHPNTCPECLSTLTKPGVIFFGEHAPAYEEYYKIISGLTKDDTFIIIGASLNVLNPISSMKNALVFSPLTQYAFGQPRIIIIDKKLPSECALPGIESIMGSAADVLPEFLPTL